MGLSVYSSKRILLFWSSFLCDYLTFYQISFLVGFFVGVFLSVNSLSGKKLGPSCDILLKCNFLQVLLVSFLIRKVQAHLLFKGFFLDVSVHMRDVSQKQRGCSGHGSFSEVQGCGCTKYASSFCVSAGCFAACCWLQEQTLVEYRCLKLHINIPVWIPKLSMQINIIWWEISAITGF